MTFREIGKSCLEFWACGVVGIVVVGQWTGAFEGMWVNTALAAVSPLLFAWLLFFAIGGLRGEPNP